MEDYDDVYCFEINKATPNDEGPYTCTAVNKIGKDTATIPISVKRKLKKSMHLIGLVL